MSNFNANIRNHTIDFLKGLAIVLVVLTHYEWSSTQRRIVLFPFLVNMAVPMFLILSGYAYSLSYSRRHICSIEAAYKPKDIIKRILRYLIPFIVIVIWEVADSSIKTPAVPLDFIRFVLVGTMGKGSYFVPVVLQLVFIFPFIYFIIERKGKVGLLVCFFINAIYELLCWAYGIETDSYRLLVFRYLFPVSAGVYVYKGHRLPLWLSILMITTGICFIIAIQYMGYQPYILNRPWASTNFISSLYIIPIIMKILPAGKIRFAPLELIGRASYHIFLVQMIFYMVYSKALKGVVNEWICCVLGVLICLSIGIAFYYIDLPVQKLIGKKISSKMKTA